MQTIYIDVLFTVNIFIDFFLILCVKKFLDLNVSLKRIIAGSLLGGLFSIVALLPKIPIILNLFLDLIFALAIVFVSFGKTPVNNFIKRVTVYFITKTYLIQQNFHLIYSSFLVHFINTDRCFYDVFKN